MTNICWVILYSIIHPHMHNCMCAHSDSPITCMDCIPKPHIHMYIQNLWRTAFLLSLSFSHITKKNVSPEILLLQPGLWNTIHRSSWWRGNCCKIQLEVYGDRWRWIPLSVIPLSSSLPHKCTNMDSHTRTWAHFLSLSELHEIHPQLFSILLPTARESFSSLGLVSVGSASLLSVQPLLPWWGEASSVEVLSAPI